MAPRCGSCSSGRRSSAACKDRPSCWPRSSRPCPDSPASLGPDTSPRTPIRSALRSCAASSARCAPISSTARAGSATRPAAALLGSSIPLVVSLREDGYVRANASLSTGGHCSGTRAREVLAQQSGLFRWGPGARDRGRRVGVEVAAPGARPPPPTASPVRLRLRGTPGARTPIRPGAQGGHPPLPGHEEDESPSDPPTPPTSRLSSSSAPCAASRASRPWSPPISSCTTLLRSCSWARLSRTLHPIFPPPSSPSAALATWTSWPSGIGTVPGGHRDMIDHGRSGLLVHAGDVNGLRDAIQRLPRRSRAPRAARPCGPSQGPRLHRARCRPQARRALPRATQRRRGLSPPRVACSRRSGASTAACTAPS